MSQPDLLDQDPVFLLKGSMLATTILELSHNDLARLDRQLEEKVAQAPAFFENIPLIIAVDKLPEAEGQIDLAALMQLCGKHGLRTLALRAGREEDIAAASALDLPVLPPSGAREKLIELVEARQAAAEAVAPAEPEKPREPERKPSKVINHPVRGGQQIYAADGDLVVLGPVSAGAELLADGNIHIYGPMRGRALAGVKGDTSAQIFCQQMGAEMLSIAGIYKVAEDLRRDPQWGRSVHVSLSGDVLNITRL